MCIDVQKHEISLYHRGERVARLATPNLEYKGHVLSASKLFIAAFGNVLRVRRVTTRSVCSPDLYFYMLLEIMRSPDRGASPSLYVVYFFPYSRWPAHRVGFSGDHALTVHYTNGSVEHRSTSGESILPPMLNSELVRCQDKVWTS